MWTFVAIQFVQHRMFFIIFWEVSLQLQPYAKLSYQAVASHLPVGWHQASHRPLCQKGNKSHFKLWTHVWLNISDIKPNKDEVQKLYLNIWTVLIPRAGFKHSAVFGFCLLCANADLYLSKPKWIRTCCFPFGFDFLTLHSLDYLCTGS